VVVVPEYGLIFGAFALLIPVAMGGIWRRRRRAALAGAANRASGPLAHSHIPPGKGHTLAGSAGRRSGR
ncbi:MAG: hypothetical protein ACC700_12680, partial [Anaerolineales bacterium]